MPLSKLRLAKGARAAVLRDTIVYACAKGIPGIIGLLSVAMFVRMVGPTQFGRFAILSATVGMWTSFASGWFYQSVLRYYGLWHMENMGFDRLLVRGAAVCGVTYVVALCGMMAWEGAALNTFFSCLVLGLLTIAQTIALSCWQADIQPATVLRVEIIRTVVTFAVALAVAYFVDASAESLIVGAAAGYALSIFVGRRLSPPGTRTAERERPTLTRAWQYGWPLSIWFLMQLSFPWLDRVMIEGHFGLSVTGVFAGLSEILTRVFSLLVYPLTLATYPRLTRLWHDGRTVEALRTLRFALLIAITIGSFASLLVAFTGVALFARLLPLEEIPQEESRMALLTLLTAGGAVWATSLLVHKPLELQSRSRTMLAAILFAFGLKVAGNYTLLPFVGLSGAAASTLLAGLAYSGICWRAARRP